MNKERFFQKHSKHKTPDESPGLLLWQVSTAWRSAIESVLKPLDLTHPQFVILATTHWLTHKNNLSTQAEIGKMARLDPNTTSQIIKGLEKRGLIERTAAKDKRIKSPSLTEIGTLILSKALPAVELADAQFFRKLDSEQLAHLLNLFHCLKYTGSGSNLP